MQKVANPLPKNAPPAIFVVSKVPELIVFLPAPCVKLRDTRVRSSTLHTQRPVVCVRLFRGCVEWSPS